MTVVTIMITVDDNATNDQDDNHSGSCCRF